MKKSKLIILVVITAIAAITGAVVLGGCNTNAPTQQVLFNEANKIWTDKSGKETLTYDVISGENTIGTYVMTGESVKDATLIVGDNTLEGKSGIYFTSALNVSEVKDGITVSTVMRTQSYLSASFVVQNSYRETVVTTIDANGNTSVRTTAISGTYEEKKYLYTINQTAEGEEITADSGSLGHSKFASGAYIDNDFMYQAVRLLAAVGSNLSFQVPYYNYTDGTFSTVTMEKATSGVSAKNSTVTGMRGDFADQEGITYTGALLSVKLSRNFPGSGTAFTCYVITAKTNSANEADNDTYHYVPAKIKEDNIEYVLKSIS
ncbi:MAG: hypothetical protein K2M44_00820 [Clostridia bacterium]|nr:hypothetical protein [Clostridia bacterium]